MTENRRKKEFSFDATGRATPFRVPEGFFPELEANILNNVAGTTAAKRPRRILRVFAAASVSAAAVVALFLSVNAVSPTTATAEQLTVEQAFNNLSAADQEYLIDTFRNDFIIDY